MNIEDIPNIPDRAKRFEENTVDCYDEYEVFSAFEVYPANALDRIGALLIAGAPRAPGQSARG